MLITIYMILAYEAKHQYELFLKCHMYADKYLHHGSLTAEPLLATLSGAVLRFVMVPTAFGNVAKGGL